MGRYDKIKVYHNGTWKTPTYCRVYRNGSWLDLGSDTSYNTKSLYTYKNNNYVRATLNRQDVTTVTDRWIQGSFSLLPANGFCCCPKSDSPGNFNWYFKATIKKTTDTEQNVFRCGVTNSYVQIKWLADGRIRVTLSWSGNPKTLTSSNSVMAGNSVYLDVHWNKGSYTCYINFNGVTTTGNVTSAFAVSNSTNTVGDTNMQFRSTLSCSGIKYLNNIIAVSFNADTASGSDNSQYTGVNHQEATTTTTNYV